MMARSDRARFGDAVDRHGALRFRSALDAMEIRALEIVLAAPDERADAAADRGAML